MWTKLAPSFTNLLKGNFGDKYVYTYKPLIWNFFIYDIFSFGPFGQDELGTFVDHLNGYHKTITFILKSSLDTINFLDITVNKKRDGSLSNTLYSKSTDSHNYLLYSSEYPKQWNFLFTNVSR